MSSSQDGRPDGHPDPLTPETGPAPVPARSRQLPAPGEADPLTRTAEPPVEPALRRIIDEICDQLAAAPEGGRATLLDKLTAGRPGVRDQVERRIAAGLTVRTRQSPLPSTRAAGAPGATSVLPDDIGPYRIVSKLGEGGFGAVYKAEQRTPRRFVAIKMLRPGVGSQETVRRFQAERETLALLKHRGIAQVFDAGATDATRGAQPYVVLEYVDGPPITTFCDVARLTIAQRLRLFIDVCDAVEHAHRKAVIHRDLKPGNILVERVDNAPVAKVIDFGIAKVLSSRREPTDAPVTLGAGFIGTPQYMSPEQVGGNVDTRSDVYSLGVVLYELLTGVTPLDSARVEHAVARHAIAELTQMIQHESVPRPSERLAQIGASGPTPAATGFDPATVPSGLESIAAARSTDVETLRRMLASEVDWIVLRALAKDPEERYGSPLELARDIERFLDGRPVSAHPPSRLYRARKFVRRHPLGTGAAAALALALIALAVLVPLTLRARTQAAEDRAKVVSADSARRIAELEADNARRAKENEERNRIAEKSASAGALAARRGDWDIAYAKFEEAIQAGHADSLGLRFQQLEALDSLDRIIPLPESSGAVSPNVVDLIKALSSIPELGERAATLDLWRGDLLLTKSIDLGHRDDVSATDLIKGAIDSGRLAPADEAYARGLIASSWEEAVNEFQRALDADPAHFRAGGHLAIALLMDGRSDLALERARILRAVTPKSAVPDMIEVLALNLLDRASEAEKSYQRLGANGFSPAQVDSLREVMRIVDEVTPVRQAAAAIEPDQIAKLAARLTTAINVFGRQSPESVDPSAGIPLRLHPLMAKAYPRVAAVLLTSRFSLPTDQQIEEIAMTVGPGTESFLQLLRGVLMFERAQYEEAVRVLQRARAKPSILPVRAALLEVLVGAALGEAFSGKPENRAEMMKVAIEAGRELFSEWQPNPIFASAGIRSFARMGEFNLARAFADKYAARFPEKPETPYYRGFVEFRAGAYGPALRAVRQGLRAHPDSKALKDLEANILPHLGRIGFGNESLTPEEFEKADPSAMPPLPLAK